MTGVILGAAEVAETVESCCDIPSCPVEVRLAAMDALLLKMWSRLCVYLYIDRNTFNVV